MPFPDQGPECRKPTLLTAEESQSEGPEARVTGIMELSITTCSPLLSTEPEPVQGSSPKHHRALRIGDDIILPASGVRGAIRALLTRLLGGKLHTLDENAYLCQGRDVNLGPASERNSEPPIRCFLAEVVEPGDMLRDGTIRLGETRLIEGKSLQAKIVPQKINDHRPPDAQLKNKLWLGLESDHDGAEAARSFRVSKVSEEKSSQTPWRLRLSGWPIPRNLVKSEAAFRAAEGAENILRLGAEFWAAYMSRNAEGDRPELRKGDLVWLKPKHRELTEIRTAEDIESLQWARLGKAGTAMKDKIDPALHPASLDTDGAVDSVTDLFGQVPLSDQAAGPFASRICPENLVFTDAQTESVQLAPLMTPRPGCIAFYRDNQNPDAISKEDRLRGYKIYRTTNERGDSAPWNYAVQGEYKSAGKVKPADESNIIKSCELVAEGSTGRLRIAFRSLSRKELAMLIQLSQIPWRLGGGKPFGLGLCDVRLEELLDEQGAPLEIAEWQRNAADDGQLQLQGWQTEIDPEVMQRVKLWRTSQQPVDMLRYPRAVNQTVQGGHVWFGRHANPNKNRAGIESKGIDGELLQKIQAEGGLKNNGQNEVTLEGQVLLPLDAEDPAADLLYGYDAITVEDKRRGKNFLMRLELFDPSKQMHTTKKRGPNQGKNAASRKQQKKGR